MKRTRILPTILFVVYSLLFGIHSGLIDDCGRGHIYDLTASNGLIGFTMSQRLFCTCRDCCIIEKK
jgi:hypothetical protein